MSLLKLSWTNTVLSSLRHKYSGAADGPEILHMPLCRMSGCPFILYVKNNLWPLKPIPFLPITSNQKLWLFNPLSSPSCHPETFETRLFPEVKSLIWDGDCATGFPCAPEFQRLPGRQLGVRGHGNLLSRDSWENQKLDGGSASPCWQSALRLVRYLWVKKRCLGLDLQVCRSILAAPLRPLNASTGQPWEPSLAHKERSSKANTHTWLQDEWPLKGTGLLFMTHMHASKPIKLGVSTCIIGIAIKCKNTSMTTTLLGQFHTLNPNNIWTTGHLTAFIWPTVLHKTLLLNFKRLQKGNSSFSATNYLTRMMWLIGVSDIPLEPTRLQSVSSHSSFWPSIPQRDEGQVSADVFEEIKEWAALTPVLICSVVEPWQCKLLAQKSESGYKMLIRKNWFFLFFFSCYFSSVTADIKRWSKVLRGRDECKKE